MAFGCLTDTILIKGTFLRLARYFCLLCRIIYGALIIPFASLPEAAAAGIFGMFCIIAFHLNVILTAKLLYGIKRRVPQEAVKLS